MASGKTGGDLTFESEALGLKCGIHTVLAASPLACVHWPRPMGGRENAVKGGKEERWFEGAISLPGWQLGPGGAKGGWEVEPSPVLLPRLTFGGSLAVLEPPLSLLP